MKRIEISCNPDKRAASIKRMRAYQEKRYIDRVPVQFGIEARYLLKERGVGFLEYFESPESNFYHQLMNFKWRMENIEDDFLSRTQIDIFPDFQNVTTAALFNMDAVSWSDTETPKVNHFIKSIEELRNVKVPDLNTQMGGRKKFYVKRMMELKNEYCVELNGEPIPINVHMGWHETMFPGALDMVGENLLLWMYEYPEDVKAFFDVLTDACILYETEMRRITGENRIGADAIIDGAEMISQSMFEEFAVPSYAKFYESFEGHERHRGVHGCGNITHLLPILKDKLKITLLNGFGFSLNIQKLGEIVGDAFFYSGGLNPMTLCIGSEEEVKAETRNYIEALKPYGAYMFGDGYNVVPGTSVDRMNNLVSYVKELGI